VGIGEIWKAKVARLTNQPFYFLVFETGNSSGDLAVGFDHNWTVPQSKHEIIY
jgi:hypothetical protein